MLDKTVERYRSWMDDFQVRKGIGGLAVSAALLMPIACSSPTVPDRVTTCPGSIVVSEGVTDDGRYDVLLYGGCTEVGGGSVRMISRLALQPHGSGEPSRQRELVGRNIDPRETGTESLPLADHPKGYSSCEVLVRLNDGLIRPNRTSVSCTPASV